MADNPGDTADDLPNDIADAIVREILDNRLSLTEVSPSGELRRAINRYNRNRASNPPPLANGSSQSSTGFTEHTRATRAAMDRRRERTASRDNSTAGSPSQPWRAPPLPSPFPPPSFDPSVIPPERQMPTPLSSLPLPESVRTRPAHIDRSHERRMAEMRQRNANTIRSSSLSSNLADLHQAGQQLETASSHLRALINEPLSVLTPRSILQQEYNDEAEAVRAFKRRKMDTGQPVSEFKGFRYGRYGQVESGPLKMEIESCDGGIYSKDNERMHSVENVLKADSSVYCTKGSQCNLVLRHQGETAFCLQELIVKAPPRGYTAPVQEGMVFISMTADDLLSRTARYKIKYTSSRDPLRDPENPNNVPLPGSIRYNADGTESLHMDASFRRPSEYRLPQLPSDFNPRNELTQSFHVTTACEDSDSDSGSSPPPFVSQLRRRNRIRPVRVPEGPPSPRVFGNRTEFGNFVETDEDDETDESESNFNPPLYRGYTPPNLHDTYYNPYIVSSESPPAGRRSRPANVSIELTEAVEAAEEATQEAVRAVGGTLMAPHARFFIERDKSKCTIRFDPPVSGRYVLIKMWSPQEKGNIDVQSVVVKGFAGPRFFPAVEMR